MLRAIRAPKRARSPEVQTAIRTSRPTVWIGVSLKWPGRRTVEEELAIVKHAPRFQSQHGPPAAGRNLTSFANLGRGGLCRSPDASGPECRINRFLRIAPFRSGAVLDWLRKAKTTA